MFGSYGLMHSSKHISDITQVMVCEIFCIHIQKVLRE